MIAGVKPTTVKLLTNVASVFSTRVSPPVNTVSVGLYPAALSFVEKNRLMNNLVQIIFCNGEFRPRGFFEINRRLTPISTNTIRTLTNS